MKSTCSWIMICIHLISAFLFHGLLSASEIENNRFSNNAIMFSGNANYSLAEKVADYLGVCLGNATVTKFSDGEIEIRIKESVRNREVYLLQPICNSISQSVNDHLIELYLLIRTMKRASAAKIIAVIPYYGYARQDRKTSPRVPISAADMALLLETAGVDRIITIDLHCGQIQGFFHNVPVDNLYAATMFVPYFAGKNLKDLVVVSPDAGGVERAKKFLEYLGKYQIDARLAIISKLRARAGVIESMSLIGSVEGSDAIIIDDMCDTAGTLVQAAQMLKEHGARRVFAAISHPVFSGPALERIRNSAIDEIVISDTIPLRNELIPHNIKCISMAPLLAEAMIRIHFGNSVSDLFQLE